MDDLAYFPPETETFVGCLFSGLRVRWYERGPRAEGRTRKDSPTVVLLHGFPGLAVSWRDQIEGLSEDYRVVAPDMRGYGGTDAPKRVRDYDLDLLVRDVVELIDALGEDKVHLVGHDWGAVIAWEVAQRHGDRLHSMTAINCPPWQVLVREFKRPEQLKKSWYMFFFQLPIVPERMLTRDPEKVVRGTFRERAHNKSVFTAERLEPYVRQLRERGMPGINYYRALVRRIPRSPRPIRVPTRLIWGTRDHALGLWYADPDQYGSWVDDFDRVLIEESGHWPPAEAPERVNAALREHIERVEADAARVKARREVG